ncbi:MAG: 23S rRNA (adenine(2503)-C(2))-methyltransferase RlmN [Proteobacteria bacterium]|nr:23S rRNA (adenine(2503)-C(2))-methyltransferase RlmN [Pseudomonadota bacterium]
MKNLREYTLEELKVEVEALGEKPYRALQIYKWVFARGVTSIESMTDISKAFRERLCGLYSIEEPRVVMVQRSRDGTRKFLTELFDGVRIETVIIPGKKRTTLCVSTQAGCALGCEFCMTGKGGFVRNLTLAELTGQLLSALAILAEEREQEEQELEHRRENDIEALGEESDSMPESMVDDTWEIIGAEGGETWQEEDDEPKTARRPITNVVLMGMGEPLLNYDNVVRFLGVLTDGNGFGMSHNKVTLSTAGVVPALKRLGADSNVNIAISLNATTNEVRDAVMPINRKYPIEELLRVLATYPLTGKKHITFEYVLLGGVNDTDEDAYRLMELLKPVKYKINLIPFNPYPGSRYKAPDALRIKAFYKILQDAECNVVIRASMGADIAAACGQLKGDYISGEPNLDDNLDGSPDPA